MNREATQKGGGTGEDSGKNMRRAHVERRWKTEKRIQSNIFCSPRYGVNFTKYLTKSKACKAMKEGTGEKKGIRRHPRRKMRGKACEKKTSW